MEKILHTDTLFLDFLPFLGCMKDQDEQEKKLKAEAVHRKFGDDGFWGMNVREFAAAANGNLEVLFGGKKDLQSATVMEYYLAVAFREFADTFAKQLQALTIKPSAQETQAQNACIGVTFLEGTLFFLKKHFTLQSYDAAGEITLANLLLAKKESYNDAIYQRTLLKLQQRERKRR